MPATISAKDLWTQLRGCENGLRFFADHLGNWIGRDYETADDPIRGVSQKQVDIIMAPFHSLGVGPGAEFRSLGAASGSDNPGIVICVPPWCWDTAQKTASDMRQLAKRMNAIADVMQLVAKDVPDSEQPIYVSEVPGTCWTMPRAHDGQKHEDH